MTRMLAIVNLSERENEEYVLAIGDELVRLSPGERLELPGEYVDEEAPIKIVVMPIVNPEAPGIFARPMMADYLPD